MKRKLVVTTPVHNRKEETLRCLSSISRSRLDEIDLRIIVVDDGSTDGTEEAIRSSFPDVEIIKGNGDLWYTAGTNRGIEAALQSDPDYILAINDDSIFDENCISRLIECADHFPRSVVGALLLNREEPHKVFQIAPEWQIWKGGLIHLNHQTVWSVPRKPWEVRLIVGNCVLYPADAIRKVGLMDEKRFAQFGDAEYTPRMRKHGWRLLIEPHARVFCKPNDTVKGFRSLDLSKKVREALLRPQSPYSIRRKIFSNLANAPNLTQGLLSIPIFYIRVLLGKNAEGSWGTSLPERPLVERYELDPGKAASQNP